MTDDWTKKKWYGTVEYYSAIKKNKFLQFAVNWMDLKCIIKSKTKIACYHLHMESKKNKQMNIITETDSQREQTTDY